MIPRILIALLTALGPAQTPGRIPWVNLAARQYHAGCTPAVTDTFFRIDFWVHGPNETIMRRATRNYTPSQMARRPYFGIIFHVPDPNGLPIRSVTFAFEGPITILLTPAKCSWDYTDFAALHAAAADPNQTILTYLLSQL